MDAFATQAMHTIDVLASLFVFVVGLVAASLALVFPLDRVQTRDAVLRNYSRHRAPARQSSRRSANSCGNISLRWIARDAVQPCRAQLGPSRRGARGSTVAFCSTKYLKGPGAPLFVNCAYPLLDRDVEAPPLVIGPFCSHPHTAASFFKISPMSYGALSKPAVLARSKGAKLAGCWMNTGEGGLAPEHLP